MDVGEHRCRPHESCITRLPVGNWCSVFVGDMLLAEPLPVGWGLVRYRIVGGGMCRQVCGSIAFRSGDVIACIEALSGVRKGSMCRMTNSSSRFSRTDRSGPPRRYVFREGMRMPLLRPISHHGVLGLFVFPVGEHVMATGIPLRRKGEVR